MKRPGMAPPALAQTMSGGVSLFQAVTSSRTRMLSSGFVRSALMEWKRCWDGFDAAFWTTFVSYKFLDSSRPSVEE